jgi:hypothetical protein
MSMVSAQGTTYLSTEVASVEKLWTLVFVYLHIGIKTGLGLIADGFSQAGAI